MGNNMDDGLELNIVCEESSSSGNNTFLQKGKAKQTAGAKRRLKRGKNKYDRRREHCLKHKERKKQQQQEEEAAAAVVTNSSDDIKTGKGGPKKEIKQEDSMDEKKNENNDAFVKADDDNNKQEENKEEEEEEDDNIVMKSDENDAIVESLMRSQTFHPEPVAAGAADDNVDSDDNNDDDDKNVTSSLPSLDEAEVEKEEQQDPAVRISRRVHASDALGNEEERAKYMAEYHARPLEMDRRSNASKTIKSSKPSNHIFVTDDTRTDEQMKNEQQQQQQSSKNDDCPFRKLGLHERLVTSLTSQKRGKFCLERPTVIQCRTITSLLPKTTTTTTKKKTTSRHNLFVQSETGSGKTLAYLLPIVQSLAIDPTTNKVKQTTRSIIGTRCIIICPTRELAVQTHQIASQLCLSSFSTFLVSCCLSGGEKRKSEKSRLRKGASIVIATPGRLLDHLSKTECFIMSFKKGSLDWLVLDEADRLLDMGLGHQIEKIVHEIKVNQRGLGYRGDGVTWRSVLVSATVTKELEVLARQTLGGGDDEWRWARATIDDDDEASDDKTTNTTTPDDNDVDANKSQKIQQLANAAPRQLAQLHVTVSAKLRLASLVGFLVGRVVKGERTVVFMSTCDGVDYHHALFSKMDSIMGGDGDNSGGGIFGSACRLYRLHGNVPHSERHSILAKFTNDGGRVGGDDNVGNRKSSASILFATDVAARGLNIPGVDWIVQYDPPCETSDYVHRAGRTARAGRAGHAVVFLLPSESQYVDVLRLRGLNDVTALSLSSTLRTAAKACPEVTAEGVKRSGGGYGKLGENGNGDGRREGEAFAAAIQMRLEECVREDDNNAILAQSADKKNKNKKGKGKKDLGELHEMARQAFWSHLRAYPAKEKAVRHIFSARSLHLGHVARSFALKEPPKALRVNGKRRSRGGADNANRVNADDSDDEPVLKSTGRKRSSRLAFGTSSRGGGGGSADRGMDITHEKEPKSSDNVGNKSQKKRQRKAATNYDDEEQIDDRGGHSKRSKSSTAGRKNAQIKMMAAAKRMQASGMEFF